MKRISIKIDAQESWSTVLLNGVSDDEPLTPSLARRALRAIAPMAWGVVLDPQTGRAYRITTKTARRLNNL